MDIEINQNLEDAIKPIFLWQCQKANLVDRVDDTLPYIPGNHPGAMNPH